MRSARRKMVAVCDYSMPCRKRRQAKGSMYWWNDQLAALNVNASQRGKNSTAPRGMLR